MSTWHDLAKLREEIALANATRADFYVYVLFRETGEPFYVGKGVNGRWLAHEWEARNGAKGHRFAIIRSMQARGLEIPKVKLHEGLTAVTALAYEIELIAAIGRRHEGGPLVNSTAGGEGVVDESPEVYAKRLDRKASLATRAKLSTALRGKKKAPEAVAKIRAANIGKKHTPEARAKQRAAKLGKPGHRLTPEHRAAISAAQRGRPDGPLSDEHRAKISAALSGKVPHKFTPAARAKMSAAKRGKTRSPHSDATRANMRAAWERRKARVQSGDAA